MGGYGFLAIWTEIDTEHLLEYRHWLTREHIGQRIFSTGFLGARVYVHPENEHSHFILYATQSPAVLGSDSYLTILNNPTPWTRRMMPRLKCFDRGAGEQVAKVGDGAGAWIIVSRIAGVPRLRTAERLIPVLSQALTVEGVVSVRLFSVDHGNTGIQSSEKRMRSGLEGNFQSLLVIEACSSQAAAEVRGQVYGLIRALTGQAVDARQDIGEFRFVYGLLPFDRAGMGAKSSAVDSHKDR